MSSAVILQPQVDVDLDEAADYIGRDNPDAARRLSVAAHETFRHLGEMPEMAGYWDSPNPRLAGIHVWPIKGFENYLIFYRFIRRRVIGLCVLNAARDIESLLLRY